jgi:RNA polymerase sigma-70 factor (ECF subfamily)
MNHLRRKHRQDVSYDGIGNFDDFDRRAEDDPLSDLLNNELAGRIESCVAHLPPLQREVIILREFEDLTYEEISRVTQAELKTVKSRLHRARQTLAKELAAYMTRTKKGHHELC